MRIVHITSAHPAQDVRIFYKEAISLQKAGHEVHIVAPSAQHATFLGIHFHAIPNFSSVPLTRWKRLYLIYKIAKQVPADIFHFHDPEFILLALLLKLIGKPIIYDVHEDTPVESRSFNKNKPIRAWFKSWRWRFLEGIAKLFFNGFVCATPTIARNFPTSKSVVVCNYVSLQEFESKAEVRIPERENNIIYAGGIMKTRGIQEMLEAMDNLPDNLNPLLKLMGTFHPPYLQNEMEQLSGWRRVSYLGWLDRSHAIQKLNEAKIGLVLLHPEENFKKALPIKLFEYMAAGLPVIASDFPLWREIVSTAKCGILVDPLNVSEISDAISYLLTQPKIAEEMGRAGNDAVKKYYNWETQAHQLIQFYERF